MNESLIQQFIARYQLPGLALGIQRGDNMLHEGCYGYANVEHNVPVNEDTCFEIASVTKLFTAQAVLRLVQDERITLDDPVSAHIPGLPEAWQTVTIRHCLAHQSGIPGYTSVDRYWEITRVAKTHNEVFSLVRDLPLSFAPGTRYSYDNTGFYLLGMLIEAVTGQPYGEYLRSTVFEPLGMSSTIANDYARIIPHRAQGYVLRDGVLANKDYYDISNTFSAGILLSTVRDLLKWSAALSTNAVLNDASRELWWTVHPSQENNERASHLSLTLGWFIVDHPKAQFYGHNGGIEGFASSLIHFPATGITAVVLCNGGQVSEPHQIALDLLEDLRLL